jgi:hypothetical protein
LLDPEANSRRISADIISYAIKENLAFGQRLVRFSAVSPKLFFTL